MTQSTFQRVARLVLSMALFVLTAGVAVVTVSDGNALADGTPNVSLTKTVPAEVLYGEDVPVTLTLSNPVGPDGFNASFSDVLPIGVSYVAGSATPQPREIDPGDGTTVLVWDNVADSLSGTTVTLDYSVRYDRSVYDAGDSVGNTANAYVSDLVRFVPRFDPTTGVVVPGSFTGFSEGVTASTELLPFRLTKTEPNDESELLRGVHDHQTVFTLRVDNNLVNPTDDFSIVDFVPAGLEFLGCGNVDNTTAGVEEYTGSGRINDAGNAPTLTNPCPQPTSVTTVFTDPDGSGPGNPLPEAVYTRVEWNVAALGTDLAAGGSFSIDYVAAIPLFANTLANLNTPALPLNTIANLDNNTGPSTIETVSEQAFVNFAVASGFYNGAGTASTDDDTEVVIAEDISIHKTSSIDSFEQGTSPTFTLVVESSEYADSTGPITVTDTLPATLNYVGASAVPAPSSIPANDDVDPYTLVWTLPAFSAPNGVATITFDTLVRENYRGGGPVSSSDDFTNTVQLAATSNTIVDALGAIAATAVEDESEAGLTAGGPSISKDVALPPVVVPISECGPGGSGAGLSWDPDVAGTFSPGDIVCFRLRVQFPSMLDTLKPIVTDFLPAGFEYIETRLGVDNTIDPGGVLITFDPAANSIEFDLTDIDVGGELLEGIIAARIVDPDAAQPGDILGNLMKFRYSNTNDDVFQLRDQADVVWSEPILTLDKSVATVNGGAPVGNPVAVNEGDTVVYSVAVENIGTDDALDVSVRDVLPSQIDCGDVSGISNGGSCSAADDWIQWDVADSIDIAAGATRALTYTVVVPAGVTPGITLTNQAGVRDYRGATNTGTPYTYVPADNIDPTLTPNTSQADDTASIRTRLPDVTKTRTTGTNQPGNNLNSQATVGERIDYTVTVNVPPGTTLTNGAITDVIDGGNATTGEKNLIGSSVVATVNGTPIVAGPAVAGAFRLQVNDATNRWTVTPPNPYVVAPGATGDQIVVTFGAIVNDVASNSRGTQTGNTVNFDFTNAIGPQTASASVNTQIVHPNIDVSKRNSDLDGTVSAGQTLTYTVDVLNRNTVAGSGAAIGSVSTANDTVVVDTVPDELIVLEAPGNPAEDGDTIAPDSGVWNATSRTITWTIPTISPGATATRTYEVITTDPLVAAGPIVNDVEARTTSLPGTPATPSGELAPTERSSTSPNGGPGSGYQDSDDSQVVAPLLAATKTGDPGTATVGEAVEYTITATIPAGVVASDVTVIDDLPVGITFESVDSVTCAEGAGTCAFTSPVLSTDGDTISFFFDDVTTGASADRVITIVYTAVVADVAAADAGATLTNGAEVYWNTSNVITTPPGPNDPLEPGDFTGNPDPQPETFDVDTVEPTLTIDKDVAGQAGDTDQRRAKPGDPLIYTLVVTNTGSGAAYNVTVADEITAADPTDWSFSYTDVPADGIAITDASLSPTDGTLEWTIDGPIAPGGSLTITYQLTAPVGYTEADEDPSGPELENTVDIPSYWGVPETERTDPGLPDRDYREYDDVVADTVEIELDLASIGDTVWFDVDGDGVIETGEPRLANVDVLVTYLGVDGAPGGGDDETFLVSTDSNGQYLVEDLPGGNYTVDVIETDPDFLAGLAPSYDLDGLTATPNGAWAGTLGEDEAKRDVDFGYTGTGSIGDTIWFDRDGDGIKDDVPLTTEAGIEGVDVVVTWHGPDGDLSTADDNVEYTATTNAGGVYLVDNLPAGEFTVDVDESTLPPGYDIVTDPDATIDGTSTLTLGAGEDNEVQDFGYRGDGSIGDRIWLDQDGDGTQDVGEPGLEGVTVQLVSFGPDGALGGDDDSTFTTTTGTDGAYLFDHLPPGGYEVTVTGGLPATVTNTGDPQDDGDSTSALTLADGENNEVQDFGYDANSILGDFVWWDLNRDGFQDAGEPGIPGVEITATGPNGLLLTTTTDADGFYSFVDIPDGNWTVSVTDGVPNDFSATFDRDGGLDSTSTTSLVASDLEQDFGFAGTSSIGDRVWLDRNRNGVQDGGEPGVERITITLDWAGPDGVAGNGDDVPLTTETDANGNYLFPGLPTGDYVVTVDTDDVDFPVGVTATFDLDGGTASPNSVTPVAGLGVGEDVDTVDFGYAGGGTIGDTVWFDRNGDGVQTADEPGIGGATVTLVWYGEDGVLDAAPGGDDETFTTTTDSDGGYLFTGLPEGIFDVTVDTTTLPGGLAATFDRDGGLDSTSQVTLPVDGSNLDQDFGYRGANSIGDTVYLDLDGDGAEGATEPGIAAQTVELVWTDAPGGPRTFTTTTDADGNYVFDGLPDGDFTVTVTGPIAAAATNSGDPDGGNDSTSTVTGLGIGNDDPVTNPDQDFGYSGENSIGDRIWWDQNADGIDDAGEPGLGGVEVTLLWFGPDGTAATADDVTLPTITTAPDGSYLFPNLPDGNYSVTVGAGLPDGLDTNTFDDDADGVTPPDGMSIVTALGDGVAGPVEDLDQDFGYAGTGTIGDTIWFDLNGDGIQDAGEPGIAEAQVTLTWFGPDGLDGTVDDVVFPTQTTGPDGTYLFEHLPAGTFVVDVANIDDDLSPSADPDGNDDSTSQLVLNPGESDLDQDFGYVGTASIGDTIWLDLNGDGLQDPGEPGLPGVTVTVRSEGPDGTIGTADDLVVVVDTDADGRYVVEGLPADATTVTYDTSDLGPGLVPDSDLDDGDVTTATVVLNNGDAIRDVDFGVVGDATVNGAVWVDLDNDGVRDPNESGIPNVTVIVTWDGPNGPIEIPVVTDDDGNWQLGDVPPGDYTAVVDETTLPPGLVRTTPASTSTTVPPGGSGSVQHGFVPAGSIGDRIWNDVDRDGVQDASETGVAGVTVVLRDGDGAVISTTITDGNGNYRFDDLPPGTFSVEVDTTTLPSGVTIVSDPDGTNDGRTTVTLAVGQTIDTVDFGVAPRRGGIPVTGGQIAAMVLLAGFLLGLGALLVSSSRRRGGNLSAT